MSNFLTDEQMASLVEAIQWGEDHSTGEIRVHIDSNSEGNNAEIAFEVFKTLCKDKTAERNAVLFLNSLKDLQRNFPQELSDDFIELIDASLRIIYMGVFRKFRNDIATLAAKQKRKKMPLAKVITEINIILNKYPIHNIARLDALRAEEEQIPKIFEEPKIVITETFS